MSETPGGYDTDTLRAIFDRDQRTEDEREYDKAILKCAGFTAAHYRVLAGAGLPDALVDRLTEAFQAAYIGSVVGIGVVMPMEDDE